MRGENNGHYRTITVACAGCGESVAKAPSLINRRNNRVYCAACIPLTQKGRRGFYVGYPKAFSPALRTHIRKRDGHRCQLCGKHQGETGTLHVHHIDYDTSHNDPQNLISLCSVCHGRTNWAKGAWQARLERQMADRPR